MDDNFSIAPIGADLSKPVSLDTLTPDVNKVASPGEFQTDSGFADLLADTARNFVDTLEKSEATSIAGVKGEASAYEVATAVMEAEQAMRMTIGIRDKIISAYLEITRMQI